MVKPWKKIDGDVLGSTNAAISDAGGTEDHATWIRKEDHAARFIAWANEQMAAETAQQEVERVATMDSGYAGPFANERSIGPYRTYPAGWQPKSALDRAAILKLHFRGLDFSHVEALVERYYVRDGSGEHGGGYRGAAKGTRKILLPGDMDSGLIVFPKLEYVAALVKKQPTGWKPINLAMGYLVDVLKEIYPSSGFGGKAKRKIGPEYEKLLGVTERALLAIGAKTPGDILVLPAQTGTLFAGYSVRSSRGHMSALTRHIPLHDFGAGCFALTDPERFTFKALSMECPGTERSPREGAGFNRSPGWDFNGGLGFYSIRIDDVGSNGGSASFVLPE